MEFFNIGAGELLLVFLVALLVLGPRKLPEIGRSLGKGIREFRQATNALTAEFTASMDEVREPIREVKNLANDTLQSAMYPTAIPSTSPTVNRPITPVADPTATPMVDPTVCALTTDTPLRTCPSCGINNPANNRFCGACGTELSPRETNAQQAADDQSS